MITDILFFILVGVSMLSGIVPVVFGKMRYKAFNIKLKALFIYTVGALLFELLSLAILGFKIDGFYTLSQFTFSVFEFFIIVYIYWLEFNKSSLKITAILLSVLFIFGLAFSYFTTYKIDYVTDVADIMEASVIIILSITFFFNVFTDLQIPKLTNYPFFWLNSAFLVYFGTAFFLFLFNNVAKDFDKAIVYFLTAIHHIVNVAYNILITIAICKVKKP